VLLQGAQPRGQHIARGAGEGPDAVEAVLAERDLAQHQQAPALAEHLEPGGDGAGAGGDADGGHGVSDPAPSARVL